MNNVAVDYVARHKKRIPRHAPVIFTENNQAMEKRMIGETPMRRDFSSPSRPSVIRRTFRTPAVTVMEFFYDDYEPVITITDFCYDLDANDY